jgi:hypothetical protein
MVKFDLIFCDLTPGTPLRGPQCTASPPSEGEMKNSIAVIPLKNGIQERVGVIESIMLTSEFSVFVSSVNGDIFFLPVCTPTLASGSLR